MLIFCIIIIIIIDTASYLILQKEFCDGSILEYGPVNVAFKLKEMYVISYNLYAIFSNLRITDKHKCLLLCQHIFAYLDIKSMYIEYKQFWSNDRRLWHLSLRMSQIS